MGRPTSAIRLADAGMFLLEVVSMIGIAQLAWPITGGGARWLLSGTLLIAAGSAWGVFRTRGFVPTGGDPIVAVPGIARLVIEWGIYAAGIVGFWVAGRGLIALAVLALAVIVHIAHHQRIRGLLAAR